MTLGASSAVISDLRDSAGNLMCYEDIVDAPARQYGPLVFATKLLDQLLDLMGERHPIHESDELTKSLTQHDKRIVPGGFIHSITSGWAVQQGAVGAIIGLKSMNWDFVRPLHPDVPFYFSTEVEHSEVINEHIGVVNTVRRVFYDGGRTIAIGRMTVVMARRQG